MSSVVADTHAALWFLAGSESLSPRAKSAMEAAVFSGFIFVSTISIVEMTYLTEKRRIEKGELEAVLTAFADPASRFVAIPVNTAIAQAVVSIPRALVPDLPDRVFSATAFALGIPLVTADRQIQSSSIETIW